MIVSVVLPRKLSRSLRVIGLLTLVLFLLPQAAPAHAPSDMQLAFDQGTRVLSVTITHPVADPSAHYVKQVLATTGGSVIIDTPYTSQPAADTFTYTYPLPQGIFGEVQVKAECSIAGSITSALQVPGTPPTGTHTPAPSTPTGSPGTTLPASSPLPTEAAPDSSPSRRRLPWWHGGSGADRPPLFSDRFPSRSS